MITSQILSSQSRVTEKRPKIANFLSPLSQASKNKHINHRHISIFSSFLFFALPSLSLSINTYFYVQMAISNSLSLSSLFSLFCMLYLCEFFLHPTKFSFFFLFMKNSLFVCCYCCCHFFIRLSLSLSLHACEKF